MRKGGGDPRRGSRSGSPQITSTFGERGRWPEDGCGRASRLLQGVEGGAEHGWLAFHEGYLASLAGDPDRAVRLAVRAAELGSSIPVPDLEMLGLGLHGAVLVSTGSVSRGMALLDEATAAAMSGDAELPISFTWTFCFLVSACDQVRDYPRALEWCRPIEEFARRYGSQYMLGFCRTHYGVVDLVAGRWAEAETALNEAVEAACVCARPAPYLRSGNRCSLCEIANRMRLDALAALVEGTKCDERSGIGEC